MSITQMGLGQLGNPNIIIKRKFRWTLEISDPATGAIIVAPQFVKVNARPNLEIEETEVNYLNSKMWIPGKSNFQEITVTYFDASTPTMQGLWDFLTWQYNGGKVPQPIPAHNSDFFLKLYDGCGCTIEEWKMSNAFITAINFGELDYTSSEEVTVEMSIRYSQIEYKNHCGGVPGYAEPWGGIMASKEDTWTMPDEWIIKNPVMESSSPGERILDQFLHRMSSR